MSWGKATIEDVARAAGVSRQTVSRVINRRPNVREAVRARVEQAIEALGYVPNTAARRMGGARSYLLFAVIEQGAAAAGVGERTGRLPLDGMLLAGLEVAARAGYHVLFEQIERDPVAGLARFIRALTALSPDGVILTPPLDDRLDLREALAARGIATEFLGHGQEFGALALGIDESALGEAAARYLLKLGHKQIGFVSGSADPQRSHRRVAGYRRVMAAAGSRAQRHFVADERLGFSEALPLAKSWLVPTIRPTAIIAETEEVALAILEVANELAIAVPEELSLLSLENRASLTRSKPPISALFRPYVKLFAEACERLVVACDGEAAPAPGDDEPFALIERESVAKAPRAV
ncbi:MAG: LacI family DNA-binding transcriptional regulator [Erythrobacter sp.]|nr:LacI family DNA-binding transcriptional regulator [Erythrobacter sp.]